MDRLSGERRLRRAADSVWSQLGDEIVVLDLASSSYLGLQDVGAVVWAMLEEPRRVKDLVAELAAEYGVDVADLANDLRPFLEDLLARGLVVVDEDDPESVP